MNHQNHFLPRNLKGFALTNLILTGLSISSAQAMVVYQDFFIGDGIGTNTGIGGAMISGTNIADADPFADDEPGTGLTAQTANGNRVAIAFTTGQFDLSAGFTLEAAFTSAASTFGSNALAIAIVDELDGVGPLAANGTIPQGNMNALFINDADLNAVGFLFDEGSTAPQPGTGLITDFGTLTVATTEQNANFMVGSSQTISLTVNEDGSGSFAIDANTPTTFATGTFSDLFTNSADDAFHVVLRSQGNPGLSVSSLTLTTVPEPSSLALLVLGGLAFARRRR